MQVFFSFCGADRMIKDEIVASLRASLDEGDTVWESDLGCASDFSEECIREIKRSQVYIILVSDASMQINYTVNEAITARQCEARGDLNMVVYKITPKPYPDNLELQLNHISDANFVSRLRNDNTGVATLTAKVKRLLALRKNGTPEKPCEIELPEINAIPLGSSGFFVEGSRDDLMLKIGEHLGRSNIVFLSHISGYGRKSMLRKYIEIHKDEFDKVLSVHSFKGTLREFFLYGLEITNLNPAVFENMTEEQIAVKKCELLGRLGIRTLIVVPHLICDNETPEYLYDLLENIGCRIVFVTPGISRTIRDRFLSVDVGSMSHDVLDKIFFHYYNKAGKDEAEELKGYLHPFYDYIGGHTQSVELTANVLSSEIDIFPEDIPDVLKRWMDKEEDRLSARISTLLSGLMNLSEVSENEKDILLATAIVAQVPLNVTEYTELLEVCDIYSADDIRRLAENGWIVFHTTERTVHIEPFIADACLRNIKKKTKIIYVVLQYYVEKCLEYLFIVAPNAYFSIIRKLKHIFSAVGLTQSEKVIDYYLIGTIVSLDYSETDPAAFQNHVAKARAEVREMFGEMDIEEIEDLFEFIENNIKLNLTIYNQDNRSGLLSSVDMMRNAIFDNEGILGQVLELSKSYLNNELMAVVLELLNDRNIANPQKVFSAFIRLSDILSQTDQNDESFDMFVFLVQVLGAMLINNLIGIYLSSDYLLMRLCRSYIKSIDTVAGIQSYESVSTVYLKYFYCLSRMDINSEETFRVFEKWIEIYLLTIEEENTRENIESMIVDVAGDYAVGLAENGECKTAETVYREYMAPYSVNMDAKKMKSCIMAADAIVQGYIQATDTRSAIRMIESLFRPESKRSASLLPMDSEEFIVYENIMNLYEILTHPETDVGFHEGNYLNYYETYAQDRKEQKKTLRYMAIAKKAARIDYSSLSEQELKEFTEALKKRVKTEGIPGIEAEAFAMVSEAGKRTLGYKHHIVQYIGAAAILDGSIAEILNGEGKTYTIILAAYVRALEGKQVHIVDCSEYLAYRNFIWMKETLHMLGISTAFLIHKPSSREANVISKRDVIYESVRFAISYRLHNDLVPNSARFRYDVAIVDEADQLMIEKGYFFCQQVFGGEDEHSTALIKAINPHDVYDFVFDMQDDRSALYSEDRYKNISIKAEAYETYEAYTGLSLRDDSDTLFRLETLMTACVKSLFVYRENEDYFIKGGNIYLENRSTGEFDAFSSIYDFFLRKKHGLPIKKEPKNEIASAEMSYNEYLKGFQTVCGTTATAVSLKKDFKDLFDLEVVQIPPNIPIIREDNPPIVYLTKRAKYNEILCLTEESYNVKQPVLIVTGSVAESESISKLLTDNGIKNDLLNARNSEDKAEMLSQAGRLGKVTVTTAMANRGVDILIGGDPQRMARNMLLSAGVDSKDLNAVMYNRSDRNDGLAGLRERFESITAVLKRQTDKEREIIEKLGGLCVVGTECFEDLRTEQQLRGRSGRQGFCGESYIFYSLEDDFFNDHGLGYMKGIFVDKMRIDEDNVIESQMLNNALYNLRQKISLRRTQSLKSDKHVLYYKEVRDRLTDIILRLESCETDLHQLCKEYFTASPRTIKTVILGKDNPDEYRYGEGRFFWKWFFRHVDNDHIGRRQIPDLVMSKIDELIKNCETMISIKNFMSNRFYSRLKIYYQKLDSEIRIVSNQTKDIKKQQKFVQKSNMTFFDLIVELSLLDLLNLLAAQRDSDNLI